MHCMRCGVKIEDRQVFCGDCLTEMEGCPVDPGVAVQIPARPSAPQAKKKSRRRLKEAKPEEQVRYLRVANRCILAALAVTLAAFILSAVALLRLAEELDRQQNIGQNYGTIIQTD